LEGGGANDAEEWQFLARAAGDAATGTGRMAPEFDTGAQFRCEADLAPSTANSE
jgi:hypothetical protein